jgi:phage tail sheath protein FI
MLTHRELTQALVANIPPLADLFRQAAESQNLLPPSGAMAGVFTSTDTTRGVWNAPANVGIAALIEPTIPISDEQQEDLNVPTGGRAVNAIRTFPGRGPLVWGARTLDSNSNDWRYIQVRRTMIYVEQSVKTALNSFVFAPNTASTWTTVTSMIESFLHGLWSSGGLMGAAPSEAYGVKCGLGSTMTPDDILNGTMIVHIVLQMVHPAEFIELVFKQQMLGGSA